MKQNLQQKEQRIQQLLQLLKEQVYHLKVQFTHVHRVYGQEFQRTMQEFVVIRFMLMEILLRHFTTIRLRTTLQ